MRKFLLLFFISLPAWAQSGPSTGICAPELAPLAYARLLPAYARAIIRPDSPDKEQVFRALNYILSIKDQSLEDRAADLNQMFLEISHDHFYLWRFNRFTSLDGEPGFVGPYGSFVLLKKDGRVFSGKLSLRSLSGSPNLIWNGIASKMYEFDGVPS